MKNESDVRWLAVNEVTISDSIELHGSTKRCIVQFGDILRALGFIGYLLRHRKILESSDGNFDQVMGEYE